MRLDRNYGTGKYGLILMRKVHALEKHTLRPEVDRIMLRLAELGVLNMGEKDTEDEFFVVRLRDKYAQAALSAYAEVAAEDDDEYAERGASARRPGWPGKPLLQAARLTMAQAMIGEVLVSAKVTLARVEEAVHRRMTSLDNPGFCILCGVEAEGVEPDARAYDCEACGSPGVYGADELLLELSA